MPIALQLHTFAQISAERMLNSIAEGLVIALVAWIALRVIGRQNSGTRFVVWFLALLAIAVLPLLDVSGSAAASSGQRAITMPGSWALAWVGLWAVVAGIALMRVAFGLYGVCALRRSCTPVDARSLDPALQEFLREFQLVRRVAIYTSVSLPVPTAIGFFKPGIVLPTWVLQELPAAELKAIVVHEWAHLRRWDDWTNLIQKVLKALFFFHPAVWWVENRLSLEREMACDDMALARTGNPRAYAQCLVSLAEKSLVRRGLALAQTAVARVRHTSLRVAQILDANRPEGTHVWKPALGLVAAVLTVGLVSLPRTPRLVAFEPIASSAPVNSASAVALGDGRSSQLAETTAQVVPAKFEASAALRTPAKPDALLKPAPRAGGLRQLGQLGSSRPLQTELTEPSLNNRPELLRTSVHQPEPNGALVKAVWVVTESEQVYVSGSTLWRISVVRMTVFHPGSNRTETAIYMKAI
jgi:beta-lactamase regulating signal transducer with metallopeptidase domain